MNIPLLKFLPLVILCLLTACSINSPSANVTIKAVKFINPNIYQQASPVVVTIYQLKSAIDFSQANFFALNNNVRAILADDLLDKRDVEIRPGQKQKIRIALSPATNYIGVVAAFRHPDVARWRQVKEIRPGGHTSFTIHIATQGITIE